MRLRCAHNDVATLAPRLMLLRGPNPTGTRPALEFAGNEIAFVVPDDWTTLPDLDAALGGRPQANHCRACGGLPFLARHPRAHRY